MVLFVPPCLWESIEELPCILVVVWQSWFLACHQGHVSIMCGWMWGSESNYVVLKRYSTIIKSSI